MEKTRYCRMCDLLKEVMQDHEDISKYIDAIKDEDRASESEQKRRITQCLSCDCRLPDGTCRACGCYIAFRTLQKMGACPNRHW